ncbi:MAG: helix-turn-helix domain-containing protein [Lachnospiraceae bacterium]|jgi:excisionase family DNA binding protein|nr:helix-turn-helix domain-containing protein [Lachnospiraceae bacterium]
MREIGGNLFYESQEMAALVGVDVQSVRRWVRLGKLKAVKIGRNFLINEQDVKKMLAVEKISSSITDKDNRLKSAILDMLNERTTTFEKKSISVDIGNDEEIMMNDTSFATIAENMNRNDYEYLFSKIYAVAFQRGFNAGYGDFYEDIKNLIEKEQSD